MIKYLIGGVFILLTLIIILLATGIIKLNKDNENVKNTEKKVKTVLKNIQKNMTPDIESFENKQNYLYPASFEIGFIPQKEFKSANLCNDKVLYPINNIDVDYQSKAPSSKCPCTQFIQAP